jgi:hypothetical protein
MKISRRKFEIILLRKYGENTKPLGVIKAKEIKIIRHYENQNEK